MKVRAIFCFMVLAAFAGCNQQFSNESDFYKWWNDKNNGLVKEKIINDFKIIVRYVPLEYLLYTEQKNSDEQPSNSVVNKYKHSRTFLLSIEPIDARKDVDLLFQDASSYGEYKERVIQLNFNPGEYISLNTKSNEYKPILSTMENAYNIDVKKTLYLVFVDEHQSKELMTSSEIDLRFNDQIFMTGINHFVFYKKDLDNIPLIKFNNKKS